MSQHIDRQRLTTLLLHPGGRDLLTILRDLGLVERLEALMREELDKQSLDKLLTIADHLCLRPQDYRFEVGISKEEEDGANLTVHLKPDDVDPTLFRIVEDDSYLVQEDPEKPGVYNFYEIEPIAPGYACPKRLRRKDEEELQRHFNIKEAMEEYRSSHSR